MPRSRAPHVWQGPASEALEACEPLATANTESSFSTLALSQFRQTTLGDEDVTILSNRDPQSWHLYSKIGMYMKITDAAPHFNVAAASRHETLE